MSLLSNRKFSPAKLRSLSKEFKNTIDKLPSGSFSHLHLSFFKRLATIGSKEKPQLLSAESFVFLGDHGIARKFPELNREGDYPREILRLLDAKSLVDQNPQQGLKHYLVDMGLDYSFESNFNYWLNHSQKLINSKIKRETASFHMYPSMSDEELSLAFDAGRKFIDRAHYNSVDLIFFAAKGRGSSASALALLKALEPSRSIEARAHELGLAIKVEELALIDKAYKSHPISHDPFHNICFYGGFESAACLGAIIRCVEKGIAFVCTDLMSTIMWKYATAIEGQTEIYGILQSGECRTLMPRALFLNESYPDRLSGDPLFYSWSFLKNELKAIYSS